MSKSRLAALALAVLLTSAAQAATLRIATEPTFPPFESVDTKTHEYTGFDMDLIRLLAKKAGYAPVIESVGFDAIVPGLITGTVDVGAAGITITPERSKRVLFTDPYYDAGLSIVIHRDDKGVLTDEKSLEDRKICVQIGTSGAQRAGQIKGAVVRNFNTMPEAYLELKNKGCAAVVADKPVNGYFMAEHGDADLSYYHLPMTLNAEQFGFAVSKRHPELQKKLNQALKDAKASGEYQALYEKYFGK